DNRVVGPDGADRPMPVLAGVGPVGWKPVNPSGQTSRPRARPRRVSRRRYMVRRAGALAVLLVIVVGGVLAVRAIVGGDGGSAGGAAAPTTTVGDGSTPERRPVGMQRTG